MPPCYQSCKFCRTRCKKTSLGSFLCILCWSSSSLTGENKQHHPAPQHCPTPVFLPCSCSSTLLACSNCLVVVQFGFGSWETVRFPLCLCTKLLGLFTGVFARSQSNKRSFFCSLLLFISLLVFISSDSTGGELTGPRLDWGVPESPNQSLSNDTPNLPLLTP